MPQKRRSIAKPERPARDKHYIGDGVYAEIDPYDRLVLTTEEGTSITNRIVLEPEVYIALVEYVETLKDDAGSILEDDEP